MPLLDTLHQADCFTGVREMVKYTPKNGIFASNIEYYTNDRIKELAERDLCAIPHVVLDDKGPLYTTHPEIGGWNSGTVAYNGHAYTHAANEIGWADPWIESIANYGVDVILDAGNYVNTFTKWTLEPPAWILDPTGSWPAGTTIGDPAINRNTTVEMYEDLYGPTFNAFEADNRIQAFRWENGYDQFLDWLEPRTEKALGGALTPWNGNPVSKYSAPWMSEHSFDHRFELLDAHEGGAWFTYELYFIAQVKNAIDWGNFLHDNYPNIAYGVEVYYGGITQWADTWGYASPLNHYIGAHHGEKYSKEVKAGMGRPFDFTELLWNEEWWLDPLPKEQTAWKWHQGIRLIDRSNVTGVGDKATWNVNSDGLRTELLYHEWCNTDPITTTFNYTGNELFLFKNTWGSGTLTYTITIGGYTHTLTLPPNGHGYIKPESTIPLGETTVSYSKDLQSMIISLYEGMRSSHPRTCIAPSGEYVSSFETGGYADLGIGTEIIGTVVSMEYGIVEGTFEYAFVIDGTTISTEYDVVAGTFSVGE